MAAEVQAGIAPRTDALAEPAPRSARGLAAPVVSARGLSRRFGRVEVFAGVELDVRPGEVHAVIGENGSGKSTLLRMLAGLIDPSEGEVSVFGGAPTELEARRRTGLLPSSDRSFYLRLSGMENLRFFGRLQGLSAEYVRRRSAELLEQLGLAAAARRRAGLYSRGMLRRLAVARALLPEPQLLLLDEATHDLDPEGAERVISLVRASPAAVVWATQHLAELEGLADSVSVLAARRQQYRGPLRDLVEAAGPSRLVVRLAAPDGVAPRGAAAAALGRLADVEDVAGRPGELRLVVPRSVVLGHVLTRIADAGLDVLAIAPERPGLEEALLRMARDARDR